jgi:hypothetical protein
MSSALYEDSNPAQLKAEAVIALQHVLFDDAVLKRWHAK